MHVGDDEKGTSTAKSSEDVLYCSFQERAFVSRNKIFDWNTGCKQLDTRIDSNSNLTPNQEDPLSDPGRYKRPVGNLNYLTVTQPGIAYPASVIITILYLVLSLSIGVVFSILRYLKVFLTKFYYTLILDIPV